MQSYGTVQIGGKTYIEREQSFPLVITTAGNTNTVRGSLVLPGTADFWLKSLTRETTVSGASSAKRFTFQLGNSDGSTWYQSGGSGGSTDMVIDTLLFGSGQFPFVLNPFIYFGSNSSILYNYAPLTSDVYQIYFNFRGSYLIPTGN